MTRSVYRGGVIHQYPASLIQTAASHNRGLASNTAGARHVGGKREREGGERGGKGEGGGKGEKGEGRREARGGGGGGCGEMCCVQVGRVPLHFSD